MKRCGFYIRVSTDRQVRVEEGSLKNQDYLLTQHVELKNKLGSEQWLIVERYVDEGRSAKDTKSRPAYLRMIDHAQRFSASVDFSDFAAARRALETANAFKDSGEARLVMPAASA